MENRLQRVCVPLFKGDEKSFPFWKRRMEQYLKQDGLLYTLEKTPDEEDYAAPTEGADAAAENARKEKLQKRLKDDDAAVNQFWFALDDIAMGHVLDCRYAKHIMDTLIRIYQPRGAVAMIGLRAKLYSLKDGRYASLKELFAQHSDVLRQLETMNEVITKAEKLNTLLVAIPESYRHVIGALSVLRKDDLEAMSIEAVQRLFLDAEEAAGANGGHQPH